MAKGNLLLGTAGNSVGDVVMYRREGAQVSRVRVRKVKNPKTAAQSMQRAFFAPVAKFYSPFSIVLERSYEGLSKSKSYSKFLKTNVDLARSNGWLLPKGTGFFPLPYKLSSGSLPVVSYNINQNDGILTTIAAPSGAEPFNIGAYSQCFINAGYKNGDIVTIIGVIGDYTDITKPFTPVSSQFIIDATSTAAVADVLGAINMNVANNKIKFTALNGSMIAGAVIVARYQNDVWRRSTQSLVIHSDIMSAVAAADFKAAAIASYGATNTGDNPLVYLDGKELTNV